MVVAATFETVDLVMVIAIVVILLLLVFLAVAETGINRISHVKAEALAEEGQRSGRALERLVEHPAAWLNSVLLSVNILQTVQTVLTTIVLGRLFGAWGVVIGIVLTVVILFVFTESMPKTWAVLHTERAALATSRPTLWLVLFWPLRMITKGLIGISNWLLPGRGLKEGPFVSERELLGIVEAAAMDEVIEHEERELIESIIEFGDTVAREVMVPRPDIVFVRVDDTIAFALDKALQHGFSRLPVFSAGEDEDDVVGIAYTKDLARIEREGGGEMQVADIIRSMRFIPETKPLPTLMREMQADKAHMAIVVDEYGGISGLVTLEDVLEELVGEIVDEYDREDAEIERLDNGVFLIDGGMGIDEVNELLEADLPDEDWDTVAGFVFGSLGHVPRAGESVEYRGWQFAAEQVDGRRIRRVRVSQVAPPDSAEASAEAR
jgi:putative hemolysin